MPEFQTALCLDTALQGCGVGVYDAGNQGVFSRYNPHQRGQAEYLLPMVQEILDEASMKFSDIEAILCTVGPGTFTGLRIGMSTARALAMSLDVGMFGITTLQALAAQYAENRDVRAHIAVVIESRRQDFYFQLFDQAARAVSEPAALEAEEIMNQITDKDTIFIGDGLARFCEITGQKMETELGGGVLDAGLLVRGFAEKIYAQEMFTADSGPLYLRGADVSPPKNKPRVLKTDLF